MTNRKLKIVEIVSQRESLEKNNYYLKVRLDTGDLTVFWGTPRKTILHQENMKNIETIRNQSLPLVVSISENEDMDAPKYMINKYHAKYSVPEHAFFEIERENE